MTSFEDSVNDRVRRLREDDGLKNPLNDITELNENHKHEELRQKVGLPAAKLLLGNAIKSQPIWTGIEIGQHAHGIFLTHGPGGNSLSRKMVGQGWEVLRTKEYVTSIDAPEKVHYCLDENGVLREMETRFYPREFTPGIINPRSVPLERLSKVMTSEAFIKAIASLIADSKVYQTE